MFKYIFVLLLVVTLPFKVSATPNQLDVLIIFDQYTIDSSNLDDIKYYSSEFIKNLNKSMINSGLEDYIVFNNVLANEQKPYLYYNFPIRGNIKDVYETYKYHSDIAKRFNTFDTMMFYYQQYLYKADVVIAVLKENESNDSGLCGSTIRIPSFYPDYGDLTDDPDEVQRGWYNSLFLISYDPVCLNDATLVPHEWGHTVGLFHGLETDKCQGYYDYLDLMFDDKAMGYYHNNIITPLSYQTIMQNVVFDGKDVYRNLKFSDENAFNCGLFNDSPCGDSQSSAVELLKKYSSHFSQRSETMPSSFAFGFEIL